MDEICKRMAEIRASYSLSQVDFAKRLGVTNAHISKIEKGKTIPSEALIKLICKEFGINILWLKSGEKPMLEEELEIKTDANMMEASKYLNTLLLSDIEIIRKYASDLELHFSKTISIEGLNFNDEIIYLKMCEKLFYDIYTALDFFKANAFNYQMAFENVDKTPIFEEKMKKINEDLNQFKEVLTLKQSELKV